MRLAVASRSASRFHCLSLSTTRLSCGAPFRPACRLSSRLASRVRRLRFCLVCRPCVSFPRSRHAVSCSMPSCVSFLRLVGRAVYHLAHASRFLLARGRCFSFGAVSPCSPLIVCRAVPNDPDKTKDETRSRDETRMERDARRGEGTKRGARRKARSEGGEDREFLCGFPGGVQYIGAVLSCSSLIPFSVSSFPIPLCVSVFRAAMRIAVPSCRAFCLVCLVPCPVPIHACSFLIVRSRRQGRITQEGEGGGDDAFKRAKHGRVIRRHGQERDESCETDETRRGTRRGKRHGVDVRREPGRHRGKQETRRDARRSVSSIPVFVFDL